MSSPNVEQLEALGACSEAIAWVREASADPQEAWDACQRGDWMLWLLGRVYRDYAPETPERRALVLIASECAALSLMNTSDERVLDCLITCYRWGAGDEEITLEMLHNAARSAASSAAESAAWSAAWSAARSAAWSAARSAAWSAWSAARSAAWSAARSAAWSAARSAESAARSAAESAAWSAESATRSALLIKCADIVRDHFPSPPTIGD